MKTQRPPKLADVFEIVYEKETKEVSKDKFGGVAAKRKNCKHTLRVKKGTNGTGRRQPASRQRGRFALLVAGLLKVLFLLVIIPVVVLIAKTYIEWFFAYGFSHFLGISLSIVQVPLLLDKSLDGVLIIIGAIFVAWLSLK